MLMKTLTIIKWFWRTARPFRLQSTLNTFMGLLSVATRLAFIMATKLAIDIATGKSNSTLALASAFLISIVLVQIASGFANRWIAAILGVRAQNKMQHTLFSRLMESQWTGLEKRHSGDVLNRLERDVREVTSVITDTLPSAIAVIFQLILSFFYLYSMDAMLAVIIVFVVPLFALLSRIYVKKMRKLTHEMRQTDSEIQSVLTESIQNRMVLKTLEQTQTISDRLGQLQAKLRKQVRHRTLFSSFSALVLNAGFAMGYLITFIWGAHRLQEGAITYGMMLAFVQLVGQIQGPFRDVTRFVPVIISSLTAAERLIELEDTPLEETGNPIRFEGPAGIRFKDVSYAYDAQHRTILSHLSCDFKPGSSTAILGETGAGKTTLLRLILALLKPDKGEIEIYGTGCGDKDDTTQRTHEISPLTRCNLVYVPQGNTLFSGTIRENLRLGNAEATDEEMREALTIACADFVFQTPDGLDTICGEQGTGLSEGQAQRISIARALLRHGNILLLDEATSALDLETEQMLLNNLTSHLNGNQTLIFITHRPAIVDHCDQVLQLQRQ
ncbi:MAG: ABC transporter ATP-binding protein [Bacteroidales bacterium]|nr:ABC transporter ATP-binding protein [Candidatus Physcousia equi]